MISLILGAFLLQATYVDLYEKGHTLVELGKYKEAEVVLKEASTINPHYVPALEELARTYKNLKRFPEAEDIYKKLVEMNPLDMTNMAHLAELYAWAGDHDKSIVTYKNALEIDPTNLLLINGLAEVMRWNSRYDEAERLYREVLAEQYSNHQALKGLARTQALSGELGASVKTLRKALELYPDDPELHKELGIVLGWNKSYAEAIKSLDRAIELFPDYVDAWRTKGDVFLWMKSYKNAAAAYEKAKQIDPDNVEDYLQLAKIEILAGDLLAAENAVKGALRIDPKNPQAFERLRELRGGEGFRLVEKVSDIVEGAAFLFVFFLIIKAYRSKRRILMRRHWLYYYFISFILPGMVVITLGAFVFRHFLSTWVEVSVIEDMTEAFLFIGLGTSFMALLWVERRGQDLASRSILVVGAHPDDIELGCGGFIVKAKDCGSKVYGLTMSKGERGGGQRSNREDEIVSAAKYMGLDDFWVCDFPDTELERSVSAMKDVIEEKIRETGATEVVTHTGIDIHGDHRAVFEATKVAARGLSVLCYEDVSTPGEFVPNYFVDISGCIEDKLKLVSFHKSQGGKTYMDPEIIKGRAAHRGLQSGVQYAEAFMVYKLHK